MMPHYAAWREALLLLAAAPLVYYVLATIAALRFFRRERARKLPDYPPPVSLLKPVRGVDFGSHENFASFCNQDYPDYEILFAVNDASDPAIPLIQQIIAEFPRRQIRLLVGAEHLGANRKVNKLAKLAREAQHDTLVLTDGDVRVGPSYLREVVAPLQNYETGAVTSFYRAIAEENLFAQLEAVGAASDFFAGVLMARSTEGIRFALGASIATTKEWLAKMGGFEAIADTLADDYELGYRIAKAGGEVVLSRETVWTMYLGQTFRDFWDHQLRWARTVRLCRPLSYVGLLFTQGLPWALLAALVAPAGWIAAVYLVAYLILRFAMAFTVGVWGVRDEVLRRKLWLVPVRDAIHFVVWLASFGSNRVRWGNVDYAVREGRMVPLAGNEKANI
ncbi:MAG TPA: bacteriohopanetetrol glucosamine biosynthesis glycosyltransferase HpnI [Candidatus Acidoferrum sp.]|jgi:ceramide glucosyltransferase|nr:bacteriohopanetetrol glucosamine biosynthesis glycosyltransferase HpnI [Candidatus Acidoferrum sp.]